MQRRRRRVIPKDIVQTPAPYPLTLLTGPTGYVGGRLLRTLEAQGIRVRCMARRPEALRGRVGSFTEIADGDIRDSDRVATALQGVDVAYYLVHSMGSTGAFADEDREAAHVFAEAARAAGVARIVYLGGLGSGDGLSDHLASRQEVGRILAASGVPTVEFRAGIVIGSGSLAFDAMRALVRQLPIMIVPRWVGTLTQPIAIDDVIAYLVAAADMARDLDGIYEIGGSDRLSYGGLMTEYARQRGWHRTIIPVPILSPWLSSLWLGLVTPVDARVARKMIDGLRNQTIVRDDRARRAFPELTPRGVTQAIAEATPERDDAPTRWSDAVSSAGGWAERVATPTRLLVDERVRWVPASPEQAFAPIQRIGGQAGWYYGNHLWRLRGWMDLVIGGVGRRRGRRHPTELLVGDTIDFWRVESIEPGRRLRLRAEMKLPGTAWLEYLVTPRGDGAEIRQTAYFAPTGLWGRAYWYAVAPFHRVLFPRMLEHIAAAVIAVVPAPNPAGR
jgi:uncharacterized protein YbjT (DUF2867 family)